MSSFLRDGQTLEGTVYKKSIQSYTVWTAGKSIQCTLSPRLWKSEPHSDKGKRKHADDRQSPAAIDPIAVGDFVRLVDSQDGTGRIVEVMPRRSQLSRRSPVPMPGAHA